MARIIEILIVIGLLVWGLRQLTTARANMNSRRKPATPRFEKTVRCSRCGVHLPVSLAESDGPGYRCRERCERVSKDQ